MGSTAKRFTTWSSLSFLFWSVSASALFGDILGGLKELDPTNKNSAVAKATGHTLDPSVIFPRPRPPTPSTFGDPEPEPVNYRIDPGTGDVYEWTRSYPQPRKTGIKARVEVRNGQRTWVYGPASAPIPPDVDNQGIRHIFDGTDIIIENDTPRRFAFKASFEPDSNPTPLTFNDWHTLDPGLRAYWHLPPQDTVRSVVQGNRRMYRILFQGFDPANGQKLTEWGPNPTRLGLVADQDGIQSAPQPNGLIHQHRNLFFRLNP